MGEPVGMRHLFRRAFSWFPAQFASQNSDAVGNPRRFGSTEHLSTEAISAFVDGELRMTAHLRAAQHLSLCPECAAEVDDHTRARSALRDSQPVQIPASLLGLLSEIPHATGDLPDGGLDNLRDGPHPPRLLRFNRSDDDPYGPPRRSGQ